MQTPDNVTKRMRLLATHRRHLHSDFSNLRLMDEICPIVYFLHGKNRSALQNSQFAKLILPAGFCRAPINFALESSKINQWRDTAQSHNRTAANLIKLPELARDKTERMRKPKDRCRGKEWRSITTELVSCFNYALLSIGDIEITNRKPIL